MNAWRLLKSLRDICGFSGKEHNLKCSFITKSRSDMLITVNSAPCMFLDSLSDTLMLWWAFPPQFASSSSCGPKNKHLIVFLWQWPMYLRQLSWQLCTANICVEFLIPPHSASLQTVCVVHMPVAVKSRSVLLAFRKIVQTRAVAYRGGFNPPLEIPKALQNRAKLNPIVRTVKNCGI